LKKGIASPVVNPSGGQKYSQAMSAPTHRSCAPSFWRAEMPLRVLSFLRSSRKPISPSPAVASTSTHT
jgi:hypothetical protein